MDSQTWLRRVRKVRIRLAAFATGSAPDISVRTLAPGHGSGLLSLKSSSWVLRRCSLAPFECLPILRSGTTAPLRAGAEGVDVRVRLFRVFGIHHFRRTYRQLPGCLALPPRSLFSPICGDGQSPLGHRVLLPACTSANQVAPGGIQGCRRCLASDGLGRESTRFLPATRRRTRPWTALVRSNDCRALAVSPSAVIVGWRRSQWGHCVSIRLLLGYLPSRGLFTPDSVGLRCPSFLGTRHRTHSGLVSRSFLRPEVEELYRIVTAGRMRLHPAEKRVTDALIGTKTGSGGRAHQQHPTFYPV